MADKKKFSLLWAGVGVGLGSAIGVSTNNPAAVIGFATLLGIIFGKLGEE